MQLDTLKNTISPILKSGSVHLAYIFGSYARSDADQYSDIDLVIIADSERAFVDRFVDFWDLWNLVEPSIDLLVYTPREWEQMKLCKNPLAMKIIEEGILLYERSAEGSRALAEAS